MTSEQKQTLSDLLAAVDKAATDAVSAFAGDDVAAARTAVGVAYDHAQHAKRILELVDQVDTQCGAAREILDRAAAPVVVAAPEPAPE